MATSMDVDLQLVFPHSGTQHSVPLGDDYYLLPVMQEFDAGERGLICTQKPHHRLIYSTDAIGPIGASFAELIAIAIANGSHYGFHNVKCVTSKGCSAGFTDKIDDMSVGLNAAVEWLVIPPCSYMRADARHVNTSPAKIATSEVQSFQEAVQNFRSTNEELSVPGAKRLCQSNRAWVSGA